MHHHGARKVNEEDFEDGSPSCRVLKQASRLNLCGMSAFGGGTLYVSHPLKVAS